ncbi:hypothetical protein MJA45_18650 [Paenibacillus aurantius]|uniref:Uncharacterized protein n=1 Tax=Paenibacillus aurantius TaxID=2918900 RepID=A0AA96LJ19_9BACL|nr:hypothetical protein [Paenibacillus aurantius]WNQ14284.1 hypothetical protein MJA45_18650 [Paenibacillus aurantius]
MGWGELKAIPNEYNDKFKSIDESIMTLIQDRKGLSRGKRIFPPQEMIQEWANRYEMDIPQINWLMHSLNHPEQPFIRNEPGELLSVVPIMKKTIHDSFEYFITHAMQHENASVVNLEIRSGNVDHAGHIRPKLLLEVKGKDEFFVRSHGSHGGGGQAHLSFLVRPRLPDDIREVLFALIPFSSPMGTPPKEIILDQEVQFE